MCGIRRSEFESGSEVGWSVWIRRSEFESGSEVGLSVWIRRSEFESGSEVGLSVWDSSARSRGSTCFTPLPGFARRNGGKTVGAEEVAMPASHCNHFSFWSRPLFGCLYVRISRT